MKEVVSSNFKLGIIAGGQLAKMLTQAASCMDIHTSVMDPSSNCPASSTCSQFFEGDFSSFEDVYNFGKSVDVLTLEFEKVNLDALKKLKEEGVAIYPDPKHLEVIQDKGLQKMFYHENRIPTSDFGLYDTHDDIKAAIASGEVSLPFVQKARKDGYDGKGVFVVKSESDLERMLPGPSLLEELVDIEKELAVIVCKSTDGQISTFPTVEMEFNSRANLVEFLVCPANVSEFTDEKARAIAEKVVDSMGIEGILAIEMFLTKSGEILVNEVAPRPHNSGHHTIEGTITSQYQQHLRSILGMPLGSTEITLPSVMINILGEDGYEGAVKYDKLKDCLAISGAYFHLYGKSWTKPFRKMGHATILDRDIDTAKEKAREIQKTLKVIA